VLCLQVGHPHEGYYNARYEVLRSPLGMLRGSERLPDDAEALHGWIELDGVVLCVGRAHLIPLGSDGGGKDHDGPHAAIIPPFGPLVSATAQRPAFQIRQMGTLAKHRRKGLAATVLDALECEMVRLYGAKTGFLQAREHAVPFYEAQGWTVIDPAYEIAEIGPHRSMMKAF
jgi:GNAT superfamily N-acetyltransferase